MLQMSRRHCKTCGNPLHADDTHTKCVSRLGKSHADAALSGAECSHCECFSLASLHSRLAFFSEKNSASCALPFSSSQGSVRKKLRAEDLSGRRQASSCRLNAHLPRRHLRGREHLPVLFTQHDKRPSAVSNMIPFGASDGKIDDSVFLAASDAEELSGSGTDHTLLLSSSSRNTRLRVDKELIHIMTKAVNELGLEWSPLRSHREAGWTNVFSGGTIKPPANARPPSSPKFIRAYDIVARPHPSFCFSCSHIC